MLLSLCFIITILVGTSHQRATVLATSDTNDYSDTVGLQIFADHVDRWKNISYIEEPIGSSGLSTDDRTMDCPPCRCGVSRKSLGIVGGNVTSVRKYPWMAYIVSEKEGEPFLCGGSLINNKYVMTAAHCVVERNGRRVEPKKITVQLLRYFWFEYTKFNVTKIKVHEEFKSVANGSDIALLRLDHKGLDIGSKSEYHSVCLPRAGENFVDYNGIITGWGYTRENGFPSYVLREAMVPIMNNKECTSFYNGPITDDMMCAGYKEGGKDACVGDSGGPLHINKNSTYYEVGIVSWGHGCARRRFPGVYTRVNRYLDWLAVNTKDACSCSESTINNVYDSLKNRH